MRTIGLIGGITWHSTLEYYRLLNETVQERLGPPNSAKVILYSVNFAEIKELTFKQDWEGISAIMCRVAKTLEEAGAAMILLCANTMHNVADPVQAAVGVPLVHIADATAMSIKEQGLRKVVLLGTRYTMEMDFYQQRLALHGIETIIPGDEDRVYINDAIYNEMSIGRFLPETKARFLQVITDMAAKGAEGAILGCTEIPILITQQDSPIPVFDTTALHVKAAVDLALHPGRSLHDERAHVL